MTNQEKNDYFVSIIPMLEKIVKGICYKNSKRIDTHAIINESYLHLYKYIDTIETEDELQRLVIKFIRSNIEWTNSKINKDERVNTTFELSDNRKDTNYEPTNERTTEDDDAELNDKIDIELWYIERKCLLDMYRAQEEDKVKQIVFDCFFIKGITKGTLLAKHLKINKDYAAKYIREMKQDIRDFTNNNNKKR